MYVMGDAAVGKSKLIEVYTQEKKPDYQKEKVEYNVAKGTEGLDFVCKIEEVDNV
jgi:GTPase SAR1 family protein